MKKSIIPVAFCLAAFTSVAAAYEYPLQFTPNAGFRGLVVAGYSFQGNHVVGNCSYYTVSGASGRGGGGRGVRKDYAQTCTWDLFGNLLSVTPGAPAVPAPLSINGTQTVYAVSANGEATGTDSAVPGGGFVNTPGSHYTWLTSNHNTVLQQTVYTFTAMLKSDGDVPVNITAVTASALNGAATVKSTTCSGSISVGATCSITVTFDATALTSTSPAEVLSDTLRIDLTSDAGEAHDFIQNYTIVSPQKL